MVGPGAAFVIFGLLIWFLTHSLFWGIVVGVLAAVLIGGGVAVYRGRNTRL